MRIRIRECGVTGVEAVEALVVAAIMLLLLAMILPALNYSRRASRRMECASQMRQIGLWIAQYNNWDKCMPNAQQNVFYYAVRVYGYDGLVPLRGEALRSARISLAQLFSCPSDRFLAPPQGEMPIGLSYAPLVDGDRKSNDRYCAWSHDAPDTRGSVWQSRNLEEAASDTAILVEYWASANRLNPEQDTPAGYLFHDWGQGLPTGTIEFGGRAAEPDIAAVADVGGYTFLSAFGDDARRAGKSVRLKRMVHQGRMNLLHADGSVRAHDLVDITNKSPKDIPMWTRIAD